MAGTRIADMPDLGAVIDAASLVGELAGSGRFAAPALRTYMGAVVAADLATEKAIRKGVGLSGMDGFGAVGDGTTDDTTALQAALNSLGAFGGTLRLPAGHSFRVGNLTIPVGVTLEGPYPSGIGAPGMGNFSPPYNALGFLRTNAGTTIMMEGGSSIVGVLFAPYGMSFQQTNSSAFAGTTITGDGDDLIVENCMFMGYNQAFFSTGKSRIRIRDCNADCVNGFTINLSSDVCHLDNIQCWPFATISQAGTDTLRRAGTAYAMTGGTDDSRIVSCFSYGYTTGFAIDSSGGVALIGCAADHTQAGFGTGFAITGTSTLVTMTACLASAQVNGFFIAATGANTVNMLTDCVAFGNTSNNILIDSTAVSSVTIRGGANCDAPCGIAIASATASVDIDGVFFRAIATPSQTIFCTVATTNVRVGANNNFGTLSPGTAVTGANLGSKTVASADPLSLPLNASLFNVSGTTNFGSLLNGWAGRVVTLIFQGSLTVFSALTGVAAVMRLAGDASFVTSAGATLTLEHNGSQWFEIGRSRAAGHVDVVGSATNDNAAAGMIGEIITAAVAVGSAVTLATGTAVNVSSISLTAGDWDVEGNVGFTTVGGNMTVAQSWINTVSVTSPVSPATGGYAILNATLGTGTLLPTGSTRLSLASTTTVYLGAYATLTGGTASAYGFIRARRVR